MHVMDLDDGALFRFAYDPYNIYRKIEDVVDKDKAIINTHVVRAFNKGGEANDPWLPVNPGKAGNPQVENCNPYGTVTQVTVVFTDTKEVKVTDAPRVPIDSQSVIP